MDDDRRPVEEDLVEVYRCASELEADRARVEILEAAEIMTVRHDRVSRSFPAPDAESGGYFVAVERPDAEKARALLRMALADGVLDRTEGEVVGE